MGKGLKLTPIEIGKINALSENGFSNRCIARQLGRSHGVINNYKKNPENYASYENTGKKTKLTNRDRRRIIQSAEHGDQSSSQIVKSMALPVTSRRVRQLLKDNPHLQWRKRQSTPNLKNHHKKARLEFAKKYMTWNEQWKNVIFTDEKKWTLDGPDGWNYCWQDNRKEKKKSMRRNFGGGSLMIWSGICFNGKAQIYFIGTKTKSKNYCNMLESFLEQDIPRLFSCGWIFQHDNASVHKSKETNEWLSRKKIVVLDWPALSPDLNPIENAWSIIARKVYEKGKQYQTVEDLKKAIQKCWVESTEIDTEKLVMSMPNRIFECICEKGGKTKY